MACQCEHHPFQHMQISGQTDASGQYLSRLTATYPDQLCSKFASIIHPLLSKGNRHFDLLAWEKLIPQKGLNDLPHARNDGGGFQSHADWSHSNSSQDYFDSLRKNWMNHIIQSGMAKKLVAHFQSPNDSPPFSTEDLVPLRKFLIEFLEAQGISPIGRSQQTNQCICTFLKRCVKSCPITISFVSIFEVRCSNWHWWRNQTFLLFSPAKPKHSPENPLLSVHHCNWQSAEDHPDEVQALIQKEIDEQWVEEFHGTIEDAQQRWPKGIAMGKLGLALSDSRPLDWFLTAQCAVSMANLAYRNMLLFPVLRMSSDAIPFAKIQNHCQDSH